MAFGRDQLAFVKDNYFPTHHHATEPISSSITLLSHHPNAINSLSDSIAFVAHIATRRNHHTPPFKMSDQVQEILDVPREFLKEGIQFISKSQKRE